MHRSTCTQERPLSELVHHWGTRWCESSTLCIECRLFANCTAFFYFWRRCLSNSAHSLVEVRFSVVCSMARFEQPCSFDALVEREREMTQQLFACPRVLKP